MNLSSLVSFVDHSTSLQLSWVLLHSLWQGLAIALVVFVINALAWKQSAKLRYAVAVAAMFAMPLCVATTWYLLLPQAMSQDLSAVQGQIVAGEMVPTIAAIDSLADGSPANGHVFPFQYWAHITAVVYLSGLALMLLRLGCSAMGVRRLRRASQAANESVIVCLERLSRQINLRLTPTLQICERTLVPFAVGIVKPAILLPAAAALGLTQPELDAILLHELAHIRRGDLWVNLLQRLIESLLFFNPAVWYVSRVVTNERENCCDDIVLGECSQEVYASALVQLAEAYTNSDVDLAPIAALAATGAGPSQLKRRVMRILGVKRTPPFGKLNLGVLLTCVVVFAISSLHLYAQIDNSNADIPTVQGTSANPLSVHFDRDGNVTSFTLTASADEGVGRFAEILQRLSRNKTVTIQATNIVNDDDRQMMQVEGEHLTIEAIRTSMQGASASEDVASGEATQKPHPTMFDPYTEKLIEQDTRSEPESMGASKSQAEGNASEHFRAEKFRIFEHVIRVKNAQLSFFAEREKLRKDLRQRLSRVRAEDEKLGAIYLKEHPARIRLRAAINESQRLLTSLDEINDMPRVQAVDGKILVVRGKKEDVERVVDVVENLQKPKVDQQGTNAANKPRRANSDNVLRGPVQLEVVDKPAVLRGEKPRDVQRVEQAVDDMKTGRIVHVYHLKHVVAKQAQSILDETILDLLPKGQRPTIVADQKENAISVTDTQQGQAFVKGLLDNIDQAPATGRSLKSYRLRFTKASIVRDTVAKLFGTAADAIRVQADDRTNSLLVDASSEDHRQIGTLIKQLDRGGGVKPPSSASAKQVLAGLALFKKHCVHCHGPKGKGDGPTARFLDPSPRNFVHDNFAKVRKGTTNARKDIVSVLVNGMKATGMPSFGKLEEQELFALAAYIDQLSRGSIEDTAGSGDGNSMTGKWLGPGERVEGYIGRVIETDSIFAPRNGNLRFPVEVERAMLGAPGIRPERRAIELQLPFSPEVERGMKLDSEQRRGNF